MVCYLLYSSSSFISLPPSLPLYSSLACSFLGDRHRFSVDNTEISRSGGRWGGDGRQRGGKGTASVGTDAAQQHLQKGTESMCSVYIMHRDCMPNNACIFYSEFLAMHVVHVLSCSILVNPSLLCIYSSGS